MINQFKSEQASWLIRSIVNNEEIMALDPVIAGGCALSVYKIIKLYDTPERWAGFQNKVKRNLHKSISIDKFGDIDIWFLAKNEIYNEESKNGWLISEVDDSEYIRGRGNATTGLCLRLKTTSKWANSYTSRLLNQSSPLGVFDRTSNEFQFIKVKIESPEELLGTFDFINCCVAWHDGVMYYDSRLDDAFNNFELRLNSDAGYADKGIASKVFNALRAFKYAKRYGLDFSDELSSHILNVYCESSDIDYSQYKLKVIELETLYGKKLSSVDALKSMVKSLYNCFSLYLEMKTFKPENALYLVHIADKIYKLKEYIEKYSSRENLNAELNSCPVSPHSPLYIEANVK